MAQIWAHSSPHTITRTDTSMQPYHLHLPRVQLGRHGWRYGELDLPPRIRVCLSLHQVRVSGHPACLTKSPSWVWTELTVNAATLEYKRIYYWNKSAASICPDCCPELSLKAFPLSRLCLPPASSSCVQVSLPRCLYGPELCDEESRGVVRLCRSCMMRSLAVGYGTASAADEKCPRKYIIH